MLGGSVASISQWLFPEWQISIPSFMLVGMGAFFSGVARTPFSAMIMISDIIGSYALLPPLMIVSMITFVLSSRWSLYKGQVHNRFKSPAHFWDMRFGYLERLKVREEFPVLHTKSIISSASSLKELEKISLNIQDTDFVVTHEKGEYCGMFSLKKKIRIKKRSQTNADGVTMAELCDSSVPFVRQSDTLTDALEKITKSEMDKAAVVDEDNRVLGYILQNDIFAAYRRQIRNQNNENPKKILKKILKKRITKHITKVLKTVLKTFET